MDFYTNVVQWGNFLLVRGVYNKQRVNFRLKYKPTLFVPSKRKTKYKTLEGESVEPIQPGFVRDCREFYKKYDEVENFKIYGNDRYVLVAQWLTQPACRALVSNRSRQPSFTTLGARMTAQQ